MGCCTVQQRVVIVKTFYKNQSLIIVTLKKFVDIILQFVNEFEECDGMTGRSKSRRLPRWECGRRFLKQTSFVGFQEIHLFIKFNWRRNINLETICDVVCSLIRYHKWMTSIQKFSTKNYHEGEADFELSCHVATKLLHQSSSAHRLIVWYGIWVQGIIFRALLPHNSLFMVLRKKQGLCRQNSDN